jgi:hypothetical protein
LVWLKSVEVRSKSDWQPESHSCIYTPLWAHYQFLRWVHFSVI